MDNTTRISMTGVAASTGGSILTAAVVLLSSSLALANPPAASAERPYTHPGQPLPATGLDLPMGPVVFGQALPTEPQPEPPVDEQADDGSDPRDTPPPVFFGEEIDTSSDSIVFVVDLSGSMSIMAAGPFEDENGNIATGNRLDRAKAELKKSIQGLPENFAFNVMFFDECVMSCWSEKQDATAPNKAHAFAWIDALRPDGWTNTGLAIQNALADKETTSIVLLSDGAPNFMDCAMNYVGSFEDHASLIRVSNTQGATIDTFGIGVSGDSTARNFMQRVASDSHGTYTEID